MVPGRFCAWEGEVWISEEFTILEPHLEVCEDKWLCKCGEGTWSAFVVFLQKGWWSKTYCRFELQATETQWSAPPTLMSTSSLAAKPRTFGGWQRICALHAWNSVQREFNSATPQSQFETFSHKPWSTCFSSLTNTSEPTELRMRLTKNPEDDYKPHGQGCAVFRIQMVYKRPLHTLTFASNPHPCTIHLSNVMVGV